MKRKLYICPFTKRIINKNNQISSYLRWGSRKRGVSRTELTYLVYRETYGNIVERDTFKEFYEKKQYSLPMFLNEFGLHYCQTKFLIDYHKCIKRGFSEANKIGAKRSKQTNLERYGVDQTFKVPKFDRKRKLTYIKKYGVDNPFKLKNFMEKCEKTFLEKYGMSRKEYYKKRSKEIWENKTDTEQRAWINSCQGSISGLERNIWRILGEFDVHYETQKKVKSYIFDIFLPDLNILIEVNGTIFHADPLKYCESDIMPITERVAKDVWKRDREKINAAKSLGYKIIILWEREIRNRSDLCIWNLIYEKILEISKNNINKKNLKKNSL